MSWPALVSELAFVIAMLLLICPMLWLPQQLELRRFALPWLKRARVGGQ